MRKLDDPNIFKISAFFADQKRFFLVMELCEGGDLYDKIESCGTIDEDEAAKLMKSLLSAVNHCHKNNIIHRDVKPEHILLHRDKDIDKILLSDFSNSYEFHDDQSLSEQVGTPYYIAPEVLAQLYGPKCDVWSCGVVAYIALSGVPPFNGSTD